MKKLLSPICCLIVFCTGCSQDFRDLTDKEKAQFTTLLTPTEQRSIRIEPKEADSLIKTYGDFTNTKLRYNKIPFQRISAREMLYDKMCDTCKDNNGNAIKVEKIYPSYILDASFLKGLLENRDITHLVLYPSARKDSQNSKKYEFTIVIAGVNEKYELVPVRDTLFVKGKGNFELYDYIRPCPPPSNCGTIKVP